MFRQRFGLKWRLPSALLIARFLQMIKVIINVLYYLNSFVYRVKRFINLILVF